MPSTRKFADGQIMIAAQGSGGYCGRDTETWEVDPAM